jgi:hypothetical protein
MHNNRSINLVLGSIVIVFVGVAVYFVLNRQESSIPASQPTPAADSVYLEGRIVCLPGKQLGASDRYPCEYGLLTDEGYYGGKYYEFQNTESTPGGVGSFSPAQPVVVTGTVIPQKKYETDGTLVIDAIVPRQSPLNWSIEEVEKAKKLALADPSVQAWLRAAGLAGREDELIINHIRFQPSPSAPSNPCWTRLCLDLSFNTRDAALDLRVIADLTTSEIQVKR